MDWETFKQSDDFENVSFGVGMLAVLLAWSIMLSGLME